MSSGTTTHNITTKYKVERAVIVTVLDVTKLRHKQATKVAVTKTLSRRVAKRSVMKRYPEPRYRIGKMVRRDVMVDESGSVIVPNKRSEQYKGV